MIPTTVGLRKEGVVSVTSSCGIFCLVPCYVYNPTIINIKNRSIIAIDAKHKIVSCWRYINCFIKYLPYIKAVREICQPISSATNNVIGGLIIKCF